MIVPHLRGYGSTRFLSHDTLRNGEQAAVAADAIALMDALDDRPGDRRRVRLGRANGEHHGGAVAAALHGARVGERLSDWQPAAGKQPLPPEAELRWWYQYYFATERGRAGYARNRREFGRLIWRTASPQWDFDDATFDRTAASFDNPDHVDIVIHNYRWRLGLADGEPGTTTPSLGSPRRPTIAVPTITLEGDANGAPHPEPAAYAAKFAGTYTHRTIGGGVGHNLPQEAPEAFADAVVELGGRR